MNQSKAEYIYEKLYVAIDCLASGTGSLHDRLQNAFISAISRLQVEDFPSEEATLFKKVVSGLENLSKLDESHAKEIAEGILSLFDDAAKQQIYNPHLPRNN